MIFCLMALLMLAACKNSENQSQEQNDTVAVTQESNWAKQTTIVSSKPMVVDFFATWCGPCKELAPILNEVERNHQDDVIFQRIDIDQNMDLVQQFNIEGVPTLMFITPKGEYQMLIGLQDEQTIEAKITELLQRSAK